MNFAQPLYLWSLTAIAVPVAIHLLSRREGKVLKVGSLRHIGESNTSRFKSLRLNEVLLLLARCMMIAWLALFLSGAQCSSAESGASSKWLLIEQGMHADKSITLLIDSLSDDGFELRLLATGFPIYEEDDTASSVDYWGLVDELRDKMDHEIVVLSYAHVNGFTQKRISRPSNVLWISVDPGEKEFPALATRVNDDSVAMRIGYSDAGGMMYTSSIIASHQSHNWIAPKSEFAGSILDSVMIQPMDTVSISVVEEKPYTTDARMLKAALKVLERELHVHLPEAAPGNADWTFWLRQDPPQTRAGVNLVVLVPQPSAQLIRQTGPSEWEITTRLTPDVAIGSHLVTELAVLLTGEPGSTAKDIRSMPDKMTWAQAVGDSGELSDFSPTRDLSTVLALLFFITWIAERSLALSKNL